MTSFMLTTTNELRDVAVFPQIHEPSFQVRNCPLGAWHLREFGDRADNVLCNPHADLPMAISVAGIPVEYVHLLVHYCKLPLGNHSDRFDSVCALSAPNSMCML